MIITKKRNLIYILGIFSALIGGTSVFAVVLEDNFDTFSNSKWNLSSRAPTPKVVLTNTLSGANRSIQLNPLHQQDYIVSQEKFIDGEFIFDFKIKVPKKGNIFYYIGFHNTSPWGSNSSWLLIHNGYMKFQSRRQNGGKFTSKPLTILKSGKWYKLEFKNNKKNIEIILNGKTIYAFSGSDNLIKTPMTFLAGANCPKGTNTPAVLTMDYLKISGKGAKSIFEPRKLTYGEKALLSKEKKGKMIILKDKKLCFNSKGKTYSWDFSGGLHWGPLDVSSISKQNKNITPCFAVTVNKDIIYSNQFELTDLKFNATKSNVSAVMRHQLSSIEATLSAKLNEQGALLMDLKLRNLSKNDKICQPIFPIVGNLEFGNDLTGTEYFFPWRSGLLGSVPGSFTAEYGNLAWMQIMFAYNPKVKRGIYVFPLDSSGALKGLMLSKLLKKNKSLLRHTEIAVHSEVPSMEFPVNSLNIAYYYMKHKLKPNNSMSLPSTIINSYSGTWKEPLKAYRKWADSWYKPVKKPQWYKDSYIFVNQHPKSYYSKKKNAYVGHKTFQGGEDVVQWAFWEDYIEKTNLNGLSQMEKYQHGDFEYNKSRGGLTAFATEIEKIQAKDVAFTVYINYRFCWSGSNTGKKYGKAWGAMSSPGKYTSYLHPKDLYCMCFYDQNAWANYIKKVCVRLLKDTPMKGIYLDELGIQMPCYNSQHEHYKQGRYPADQIGLAKSLSMIRNAMKAVRPEVILWTEHAGSDWLSQHFDGSWDQTFYQKAFPFSEKYFDANRLCYFRFVFPEFKLAEWGTSKRHMERYFFNGMGWDLGGSKDQGKARVLAAILRENSDAIQTLTPEPIIKTSNPSLLANRFDSPRKIIYTLYNRSSKSITGRVLEKAPWLGHYVDLLNDNELDDKGTITLVAGKVNAIAFLPQIINANIKFGKVELMISPDMKGKIWAYPNHDVIWNNPGYGMKVKLTNGKALLDVKKSFGVGCKKIIFKLMRNKRLIDEKVLKVK